MNSLSGFYRISQDLGQVHVAVHVNVNIILISRKGHGLFGWNELSLVMKKPVYSYAYNKVPDKLAQLCSLISIFFCFLPV